MGAYLLKCVLVFAMLAIGASQPAWKTVETNGRYRSRSECMFTPCGESRLCLLGGRGRNIVDVLNTNTLTWTEGASNPLEMHHVQAVEGPDGCAWLAGAWTGPFPDEVTVDDIWRYCPSPDQWSKVTSIPRPRGAGAAVFYEGKLYMLSGNVGGHNPSARLVAWFDSYDPQTNEWAILSDIPHRKFILSPFSISFFSPPHLLLPFCLLPFFLLAFLFYSFYSLLFRCFPRIYCFNSKECFSHIFFSMKMLTYSA